METEHEKKKTTTTTNEKIIQWDFISWVISEPANWMGKTMTNIIIDMILKHLIVEAKQSEISKD